MGTFVVTLVITMVINGQDYEKHERMDSIAACEARAHGVMQIVMTQHDNEIKKVGIGCVVDAGDPA